MLRGPGRPPARPRARQVGAGRAPAAGSELAGLARQSHAPASGHAGWSSPHIGPTSGPPTNHESAPSSSRSDTPSPRATSPSWRRSSARPRGWRWVECAVPNRPLPLTLPRPVRYDPPRAFQRRTRCTRAHVRRRVTQAATPSDPPDPIHAPVPVKGALRASLRDRCATLDRATRLETLATIRGWP